MGLTGAAVADGDEVFTALDVFAARQLHNKSLVRRRDGWKVEGVQALDCGGGEASCADPPLHLALRVGPLACLFCGCEISTP